MMPNDSLLKSPLFAGLDDRDYGRLLALGKRQAFRDDEVIVAEGAPGDALFVIEHGTVRVEKRTIEGYEEMLASLSDSECFGEMSLIDRGPRSATVRAMGDVTAMAFPQDELDELFETYPNVHRILLINLARIIVSRLRRVNENLIQNIYDSVIVVDRDYNVLRWSRSSERDYFVDAKTAIRQNIFVLHPELLEEGLDREIKRVIETGDIRREETTYRTKDGGSVYMESLIAPYREAGQIAGAVIINRNITELKRLEQQLIRSERLAAVGQMAGEIGHELNNYLTVISGHVQMLASRVEDEASRRSVSVVLEQIRKMTVFSNGLLDMSRRETTRKRCDLNDLIRKLVDFIRFQNRYDQIRFTLDLEGDALVVFVDPDEIQQILLNLYNNAADAMGKGTIVTSTKCDAEMHEVEFRVEDDGPGIPPQIQERIFDMGFTTKGGGYGFGLAVCHRIVQNHGGRIELDSTLGRGTTFIIHVPMEDDVPSIHRRHRFK